MPKRDRAIDEDEIDVGSDTSLVDVDFEFFDPQPHDYLAIKRMLVQLFQSDAETLRLEELTDLILSQPLLGTTVKTDGRESDPYAVLTVLNAHVHQAHPSIKSLVEYALNRSAAASSESMHQALQAVIGPQALASQNHVGIIVSERLTNMPVQVVPPMYRMLADEIKWANEESEPYNFTHFLLISRLYRLTPEEEAATEDVVSTSPPPKKKKQKSKAKQLMSVPIQRSGDGTYPYHPEDECLREFASHSLAFPFAQQQAREADAFGVDSAGHIMLIPAQNLPSIVAALEEQYGVRG